MLSVTPHTPWARARLVAEAGARAVAHVLAGAAAGAVERAAVLGDAEREAAVVRVVPIHAHKVPACTATPCSWSSDFTSSGQKT